MGYKKKRRIKKKMSTSAINQAKRFISRLETELNKNSKMVKTLKAELKKAKKNLTKAKRRGG